MNVPDQDKPAEDSVNMKTAACLILLLQGQIVPIDKAFPDDDSCERAGFSMTDGRTVKGYSCLPRFMVDGVPTFDCGRRYPDPSPRRRICVVDIMDQEGAIYSREYACAATPAGWSLFPEPEGVINITPK